MVNTPNPLWERIERFQTDEPGHQLPFSLKLAREQGWSIQFTQRAIFEYKRFVYLCCVLPRGASPPPVVDAVWHLHLTYTRNYWQDFCPNCLGQELHHNPSAGGTDEHQRHQDWYAETLDAYRQIFNQPPPPDIWPPATPIISATPPDPERLPASRISTMLLIPGVLAMVPAYSLPGPAFLLCFGIFLLWCGMIRRLHHRRCSTVLGRELFRESSLTLPELAFIAGNKQRVRQLVIADGIYQQIFTPHGAEWQIDQAILLHRRPFYAGWFSGIRQASETDLLNRIDREAEMFAEPHRPLESWLKRNGFPRSLFIVPVVLGIIRIVQGLSNNRPVGFLIAELGIYLLVVAATQSRDPISCPYGSGNEK